jgi:oligo-1,6-glucosidase
VTADRPGPALTTPDWWRTGTVYQVWPRSFSDGNGDGIGDLRGLIGHLDHLDHLGVDAVWLSPVFASPQCDNGYDISDYQSIDPQFGSLEDFDELVGALHRRGMRLVLDLVVNHTSTKHAWFRESASSTDNPKRDWYIWSAPRPGAVGGTPGAEPTDWESYFSEPAWEHDPHTDSYYLHLFAREQADLNWDSAEVRSAVHAMMRWWLDRGVDGFRMDVINLISKRRPLGDGVPLPGRRWSDGSAYYSFGPRLLDHLQEMHDEVFAGRRADLIRIGETPGVTLEQARLLCNSDNRALDMVFQFHHVDLDRDPQDWKRPVPRTLTHLKESLFDWQLGLGGTGWNSLYWGNHDQPRAVSRFGDDSPELRCVSAKTLATVLYLLRGTAFVYQGDEIGMANPSIGGPEDLVDVSALNYFRTRVDAGEPPEEVIDRLRTTARDNARAPVRWEEGELAGFTTGVPWFAVRADEAGWTVAAQRDAPGSVLEHYRRVIRLRRELTALIDGEVVPLDRDHDQLFVYDRVAPGQRLRVVANFSSAPASATPDAARPDWALSGPLLDTHAPLPVGETLEPWRSFVWAEDR